jgi:hypothetical protein
VIFKCSKNFELQYIRFQSDLLKHSDKPYLKLPFYQVNDYNFSIKNYHKLVGFLYADKNNLEFITERDKLIVMLKKGTYYWHKKTEANVCVYMRETEHFIEYDMTCRITSIRYLPRKNIKIVEL